MLKVIRNTYPKYPNVVHAELGDIVRWARERAGKISLIRESDGKEIFNRDACPKSKDDTRPVVGIISQVKSKGWVLEIGED